MSDSPFQNSKVALWLLGDHVWFGFLSISVRPLWKALVFGTAIASTLVACGNVATLRSGIHDFSIHLAGPTQVTEGRRGIYVVTIEGGAFSGAVQWEISRVNNPGQPTSLNCIGYYCIIDFKNSGIYTVHAAIYTIECLSCSAQLEVEVVPDFESGLFELQVDAGRDQVVEVPDPAILSARIQTTGLERDVLLRWTFLGSPPGSRATINPIATQTTSIEPDIPGDYWVLLSGSTAAGVTDQDTILVTAIRPDRPGLLESDRPYLILSTNSATCGREYIVGLENPDQKYPRLDCDAQTRSMVIHDQSGSLLYLDADSNVRKFNCDECSNWEPGVPDPWTTLPAGGTENDPIILRADCSQIGPLSSGIDFEIDPYGGIYYQCSRGGGQYVWFDQSETGVFETEARIASFGYDGFALIGRDLVNLESGTSLTVGLPNCQPQLLKAIPGGFLAFFSRKTCSLVNEDVLWRVEKGGTTAYVSGYASPPRTYDVYRGGGYLDGDGSVYEIFENGPSSRAYLIKRTIKGAVLVVYSQTDDIRDINIPVKVFGKP